MNKKPEDERQEAYERWQKKQERRDRFSFLTDLIYRFDKKCAGILACIPAVLFVLYVIYRYLIMIETIIPVNIVTAGYDIIPGDSEYCEQVEVSLTGCVFEMPFSRDHFIGKLRVSGFTPWSMNKRYPIDEYDIYVDLESSVPHFDNIFSATLSNTPGVPITYERDGLHRGFGELIFSDDYTRIATSWFDRESQMHFIVVPAKSPEHAKLYASRMAYRDEQWDVYEQALDRYYQ